MGLVVHVVNHTAKARSVRLTQEDRDDLCAEVFLAAVKDDFAVLRRFRGESSLATYLTRDRAARGGQAFVAPPDAGAVGRGQLPPCRPDPSPTRPCPAVEERLTNREEVERLLEGLQETEARVVQLYHLEGKKLPGDRGPKSACRRIALAPSFPVLAARCRRAGVDSVSQ